MSTLFYKSLYNVIDDSMNIIEEVMDELMIELKNENITTDDIVDSLIFIRDYDFKNSIYTFLFTKCMEYHRTDNNNNAKELLQVMLNIYTSFETIQYPKVCTYLDKHILQFNTMSSSRISI